MLCVYCSNVLSDLSLFSISLFLLYYTHITLAKFSLHLGGPWAHVAHIKEYAGKPSITFIMRGSPGKRKTQNVERNRRRKSLFVFACFFLYTSPANLVSFSQRNPQVQNRSLSLSLILIYDFCSKIFYFIIRLILGKL